jgi:hypothetical protein
VLSEVDQELPLDGVLIETLALEISQVSNELLLVRLVEVPDEFIQAHEELLVDHLEILGLDLRLASRCVWAPPLRGLLFSHE